MSYDVEGYLNSKGVQLKGNGLQRHFSCPFCKEAPEKRGRLYVNVDSTAEPPGLYTCFICGDKGGINRLRKHYGDPPLPRDSEPDQPDSFKTQEILQVAAIYYHELLGENMEPLQYLRDERGLTVETMQIHEMGWADGTLAAHLRKLGYDNKDVEATGLVDSNGRDFLRNCITIPYHSSGNVVQIRGKQIGAKYLTPPGQKVRLFNADVAWHATEAVITEGEIDALVLEQMGYFAVGVPGATSWQDPWNGYFSECRKIFIVFDRDDAGEAGAERVARALGPKSRIVKMPEAGPDGKKNDPSEWIVGKGHSKDDFQMLLIKAKGGHLLSVYDAYLEWGEVQSVNGIRLGIEAIDQRLSPGILPAQLVVYLAKTSTGKTVLMLNMFYRMIALNPNIQILFISLEQTRGDWFERARRIHRFYDFKTNDTDCLNYYKNNLMIVDKNRLTEEDLIACIEQYEFESGRRPDIVAVDYLGYWARSYKGEGYERTSAAVMALKAIAKDQRLAIITPHQVSRATRFGEEMEADAGKESGAVEETADFLMTMWTEDARKGIEQKDKKGIIKLKIAKSRHGGSGITTSLQFAQISLAMVPLGDPQAVRAKNELSMAMGGDSFETAIYRHATGDPNIHVSKAAYESWRSSFV